MGNTNGRELMIADGPDVGGASGVVDDSIVINQGTSARPQPQLLFHNVHGVNVRISRGGRLAKRVESFCKGLAFSNRPIAIDENVCLRFAEIATNWSGVLRFGVTNTDPASLRDDLPKFACPDLTSKEGNWAKALAERYCQQGSILHFYVRENGDLYYGINGVLKGLFLSGINTALPLYVVVDIYGNTNSLEFVDPSEVRIRPSRHTRSSLTAAPSAAPNTARQATTPLREVHEEAQPTPPITPSLAALSISSVMRPQISPTTGCPIRYHAGVDFERLALHTIRGKNVAISGDYTVAERAETEYSGGYVFSSRTIGLNEKIVIQVLSVLPAYQGGLAFGLTCCDPIHLRPESLPDDSDDLLERGEYWVGIKDVAAMPKVTDELAFWISDEGEVHFYRNNGTPRVIMHVDHSQRLWFWFDIYGSTQKVRILGTTTVSTRSATLRPASSGGSSVTMRRQIASLPTMPVEQRRSSSTSDRPTSSSSTTPTLRVNLPPPLVPARISPPRSDASSASRRHTQPSSPPPRPPPPPPPKPSPYGRPPVTPARPPMDAKELQEGDECSVCMSAGVDCVIYTCGHMCMCYDCACEQWKRKGDCPICRKNITDVIRIYKS
uniref:Protein neuralized n=1 Tax=Plectus sambesii TaxID=2011161 RepID=A0A914VF83_9BILA